MKDNDLLRFEGPLGTFFIREKSTNPIIFLAGGTGFAPVQAMVKRLIQKDDKRKIHVYWGCSSINGRRHGLSGHVFQGRFKAILVQKETYLLELARYVVLNPVRAGMVNDVVDWHWSSYLTMIGRSSAPEWMETDWVLSHFDVDRKTAASQYIDFVRAGIGLPPLWEGLKFQVFLGDDWFEILVDPLFNIPIKLPPRWLTASLCHFQLL